eukprot:9463107-Heterocapsa_arctica.AAC.1
MPRLTASRASSQASCSSCVHGCLRRLCALRAYSRYGRAVYPAARIAPNTISTFSGCSGHIDSKPPKRANRSRVWSRLSYTGRVVSASAASQ